MDVGANHSIFYINKYFLGLKLPSYNVQFPSAAHLKRMGLKFNLIKYYKIKHLSKHKSTPRGYLVCNIIFIFQSWDKWIAHLLLTCWFLKLSSKMPPKGPNLKLIFPKTDQYSLRVCWIVHKSMVAIKERCLKIKMFWSD